MKIDTRQFRHFLQLSQSLSFTRAAHDLNMTQPPLSKSILRLEQALGVQLFERTKRKVYLTPSGSALIPIAERIVDRQALAKSRVAAAAALSAPTLVISYTEDALAGPLSATVRQVAFENPAARVTFVEDSEAAQWDRLLSEEVHFSLTYATPPRRQGLLGLEMARGGLMAALRADDPLARHAAVELEDMAHSPVILFPEAQAPEIYRRIRARLEVDDEAPLAGHIGSSQTRLQLAAAGLGRTFVSSTFALGALPDLVFRPVSGFEDAHFQLNLVWSSLSRHRLVRGVTRSLAQRAPPPTSEPQA